VGAAVALEVLRILEQERLVEAAATKGPRLRTLLDDALAREAAVGDIRGRGLLIGIELVAERDTRAPFPRAARLTETVVRAARERGVLVYSSTGCADGVDGDLIVLGPPFVITETEMQRVATVLAEAVPAAVAEVTAAVR
jgi:adenosylmethionine-8-amino-7-oxononanoate aminotransferase